MDKRKRRLTTQQLESLMENLSEPESGDESLSDPFDSDDSILDKDFQPNPSSDSSNTNEVQSGEESENSFSIDAPVIVTSSTPEDVPADHEEPTLWSRVDVSSFVPRKLIPAEYAPVVKAKLNRESSELDCFFSLFPKSLFMFIAHSTNQRLEIFEGTQKKKKKRIETTSAKEIMIVTGVSLIMHYNRVPTFAMYWSTNPSLGNEAIKNAISRDRCQLLLSKLYFNEPEKPQNCAKTYYIDEVVSCFKQTFQGCRSDSIHQSIDESMAKFKGRSSLKQYMPLKPIKRGVKIWSRCDSSTGYVYDLNIYCGKEEDQQEGTLGERVVNKLVSSITANQVTLCFDRFFTSVKLLDNIDHPTVATCMKNRKNVPQFEGKLKRGESQMLGNQQGILAIRWQDTKDFIVLSNCHKPVVEKEKRKMKDGSIVDIDCPQAIKFYNEHMGGVDLADQMTSLYDINRKSQKWWRKVYYKLLMMAVYNSYIVFKEATGKKITFIQYLVPLAESLIEEGRKGVPRKRTRKVGRHSKSSRGTSNVGDHLPEEVAKRRRCFNCSKQKREKRTKIMCRMCNVPLCMDCFTPYHT